MVWKGVFFILIFVLEVYYFISFKGIFGDSYGYVWDIVW